MIERSINDLLEQSMRRIKKKSGYEIEDNEVYKRHSLLLVYIGNELLKKECKKFIIDDTNRAVIKYLLYYFHGSAKALEIFPNKPLNKQIMLLGDVGVGKTLLMQIFSQYTQRVGLDSAFLNVSTSQMMNYYKLHSHLNGYTFNEQKNTFEGSPQNLCLNDLGLSTHKHFGNDLKELVKDFLYSRNDIYLLNGKMAHITTNLNTKEIVAEYTDEHGRLKDRFKAYNIIKLEGKSKR